MNRLLRGTAASVTLVLGLGLAGCGTSGDDAPVRDREGSVDVSVALPQTFVTKADWKMERAENAPVVLNDYGVVTFAPGAQEGTYSPMMLNPKTGEVAWQGRPVPSPQGVPQLAWVEEGDHPWVVMTVTEGKKARAYTYDPMRAGDRVQAMVSIEFEGKKSAPQVITSERGVLVLGAREHPIMQYHPHTRQTTHYGVGPKRDGRDGRPMQVYDDGYLLTFPKGGFAFASPSGGWDSARTAPEGVDRAKGQVIAAANGYVLAAWPKAKEGDKDMTLWVHDVRTGAPLVQFDASNPFITKQVKKKVPFTVDAMSGVATWGEAVFDLKKRTAEEVELNDGVPTAVRVGVVYAQGATGPLPGTSPDPFKGAVAFDSHTNKPVDGPMDVVPVGFTAEGKGVFAPAGKDVFVANVK